MEKKQRRFPQVTERFAEQRRLQRATAWFGRMVSEMAVFEHTTDDTFPAIPFVTEPT